MVAIIDYDAGNIKSVENAVRFLGHEVKVTADAGEILSADHIILPGVGAFGDAMQRLRAADLEGTIRQAVEAGKPFLGICLGMQALFEESEEAPGVKGLGVFPGKVVRIPTSLKIPHMGWNQLSLKTASPLLTGSNGQYVYFVHSYCCKPEDRALITSVCDYGTEIVASVGRGNISGVQFHPEKSSETGLAMLKRFVDL